MRWERLRCAGDGHIGCKQKLLAGLRLGEADEILDFDQIGHHETASLSLQARVMRRD